MKNMGLDMTGKYSVLVLLGMGTLLFLSSLGGGSMPDSANQVSRPQFEEQTLKDLVYYHKEFSRVRGAEQPEPTIWGPLIVCAPFLFFVIIAKTSRITSL